MDLFETNIMVNGVIHSSQVYGSDYLSEFRRILSQVKPVTRSFLEWGAGHTTLAVLQMRESLPVDHFLSIDHNQAYLNRLVSQLPAWNGFHPVCRDLTGPTLNEPDDEFTYSTYPLSWKRRFDFIFIDGRRRLECAFVATLLCHPESLVVLHDYRRARYQPVKALYDIVEDGSQFRVMRRRADLYPLGVPAIYSKAGA